MLAKPSRSAVARKPAKGLESAVTLLEVMIALAILSVFLSSLYELNWRSLAYLKAALDGSQGTRALTALAEQIRTTTWAQITSATTLAGNVLPSATPSTNLNNVTETIDVNPYPAGTAAQTLEVVRSPSGVITTSKASDGSLPTQQMVRVDLTIQWSTTFNSKVHSRMMSLMVSQNGILGRNQ